MASMQHEAKTIIKSLIEMAYFMRGAISYNDLLGMSYAEREMVSEWIQDWVEAQKKSPHPIF